MLTDDVIDKLSSYYGKAIRDNTSGTVQSIQGAVWASYYHPITTSHPPMKNTIIRIALKVETPGASSIGQ